MSANEKNKTEVAFDAVTEYMKKHPDSTVRQACGNVAKSIKSTPGAVAQAYYAQRAKNEGRPLRRRSRVSVGAVRPMRVVLADLAKAANDLAAAQDAFQAALEQANNSLHAHERELTQRSDDLDAREKQIGQIEKALSALQR